MLNVLFVNASTQDHCIGIGSLYRNWYLRHKYSNVHNVMLIEMLTVIGLLSLRRYFASNNNLVIIHYVYLFLKAILHMVSFIRHLVRPSAHATYEHIKFSETEIYSICILNGNPFHLLWRLNPSELIVLLFIKRKLSGRTLQIFLKLIHSQNPI